jgi:flagellar motor protein MotB
MVNMRRDLIRIIVCSCLLACQVPAGSKSEPAPKQDTPANTIVAALHADSMGGQGGATIEQYMDTLMAAMYKVQFIGSIRKIGEGLLYTVPNHMSFVDSSTMLKPEAILSLDSIAKVLTIFNQTRIVIEGHTDSVGLEQANLAISLQKAERVANLLKKGGVESARITVVGYGEAQPVASNGCPYVGRPRNRRIEIGIMANEVLRKTPKRLP